RACAKKCGPVGVVRAICPSWRRSSLTGCSNGLLRSRQVIQLIKEGCGRRSAEKGERRQLRPSYLEAPKEDGRTSAGEIISMLRLWPSGMGLTKERLLQFCALFAICPSTLWKKSCQRLVCG